MGMTNQKYPTDLTDSQWQLIKDLIPPEKPGGRHRELDMRHVLNAIFYIVDNGNKWRSLPHEFPKWPSVYHYFRQWKDGTWQRIHDTLRSRLRTQNGRHKHPTAGCLDSQSVKSASLPGLRGFDAAKNVNGRKRHLLVDTLGLLLVVLVTAASVQDRDGAKLMLKRLRGAGKKLRRIWVDGAYRGDLLNWAAGHCRAILQPVLRSDQQKGFVVLPRRWVVERTFSWFNHARRLSKDYEVLPSSSEAMIHIAMTRLMLRRLASG